MRCTKMRSLGCIMLSRNCLQVTLQSMQASWMCCIKFFTIFVRKDNSMLHNFQSNRLDPPCVLKSLIFEVICLISNRSHMSYLSFNDFRNTLVSLRVSFCWELSYWASTCLERNRILFLLKLVMNMLHRNLGVLANELIRVFHREPYSVRSDNIV